jgi:hypothetical protein
LQTIETKNIKNATTSIFFRAYWRCKITWEDAGASIPTTS